MKKLVWVIAIAILALPLGGDLHAGAVPQLQWEEHSPMPSPRHEAAVTKSGGRVYVMGGLVAGLNAVPLVDIYDIAADSWSSGPALPYAPNHSMAAAHGGVVYHLGGYQVALEQPSDSALALVDGAWTELPPMPEPRAAGAAEFLRGKLYVVGGVGPNGVVDDVFVFDPATQQWSTLPGPPTPREHLGLVRHEGRLIAVGGRALSFESNMDFVERWNPDTGKWRSIKPLQRPTSGMAVAVTRNDFLVVLGGEGPEGTYSDAVALDLRDPRWIRLPVLDPPRTGFGAAARGSIVYAFHGGGPDPNYYDITESIDLRSLR